MSAAPHALTPAQLDIHFDESAGSPQHYGIGAHWKVSGPADVAAWRAAVQGMERVVRHLTDPLAATFEVRPASPIAFEHVELAPGTAPEVVEAMARDLVRARWDFARGFIRVALIDVAPGDTRLVVASHHMVLDGSAIMAFSQALSELCAGRVSLDELVAREQPYAELVAEYRQAFDHPDTVAFWQRYAEPLGAAVQPASPVDGEQAIALVDRPVDEVDRLKRLCRSLKITPAFYFKCLYAWLAIQHHGLPAGVAISEVVNQRRDRCPQLLGSFAGFVPFVLAVPGDARTFGDVVEAARAFQHERRGASHLSQVAAKRHGLKPEGMRFIFNFHDYSRGMSAHDDLELVTPYTSEDPRSVQLYVYYDDAGQLRVRGSHPEGAAAAERFLDSLLHVHRQLVGGELALDRLQIASPADRAQLDRWNDTVTPFEGSALLHVLFERRVELAPDAVALIFDRQQLTYAELNRRANQVAHWLNRQGVQPDERVGLYLERSFEMLVGILGILKAGAAYLPLEPEYPAARLAFMADHAQARIVLTQSHLAPIPGVEAVRYLALDAPESLAVLGAQATTNLPPAQLGVTSRNLAYVMYTSGSTGQPKGVMIEHRSVVNRLVWTEPVFRLTSRDVCLQKTPFGFDISVWELLWPLQAGARLVIARPGGHRDPWYISQLIAEHGVTIVHFVASMLRLFIDCADLSLARGLKHVVNGGEALPPDTYRDAVARLPETRIWNLYGPTEATIESTYWEGTRGVQYDAVPIGKPIQNTRCYIVNPWRKQLPVGMVGELYLGGMGLARGYLGRADLTAEKFVDDPFVSQPGERIYATGDLARYQPDGTIEYLGRIDHQVKIRGFRIELGEIEARIREHETVREGVVVARGAADDRQLVAYVVPHAASSFSVGELRQHLSRTLPDYMVPAAIVELEAMPLSANGKLDRKALPDPDIRAPRARAYEPPRGELELALAAIWAELLEIDHDVERGADRDTDRIGRHDSFFERGGHSLLAMRLALQVQTRFEVSFPIAAVFASPTLAGMAEAVARAGRRALPKLAPVSRAAPLPLSFAQRRLWFLAQLDEADPAYHMPAVLELTGALDRGALRAALDRVVARHEILRTTFAAVDGQPVQRIAPPGGGFALTEVDLRHVAGDAQRQLVERLAVEEARRPFDLAHGPLIRGQLLQTGEDQHVLLVTQHHIVSDGWSIGVLAREVGALYRAFTAGESDPLPPLGIQYADYAAWQDGWLTGERTAAQARYWRDRLADAPVALELPFDRPRPERQSLSGATIDVAIDAGLTRELKRLSQQHETTLFVTVLAAWAAVLSRLSGQHDLVIGTFTANRNLPEVLDLIGFFASTLALRIDVSGEPDVASLLARVRSTVLAGQAHEDLPFEQVVEIVQPPRRLSHTPIFQVALAWQSEDQSRLELPGLHIRTSEGPLDTARFDLELSLTEQDGQLTGRMRYDTALFDRTTIERHRGYLLSMLRAMASDPGQSVHGIELMSASEQELLHRWSETRPASPMGESAARLQEQPAWRHEPPVGEVEREIAAVWSELLGIERIGRHDPFFEIGGHSLLATRVVSRLRRLAADLPVRAVFERPTIASLAELVSASRTEPVQVAVIPRAEGDAAQALSFAQQRLWFLQQLEPQSTAYNMFSAQRMRGELDVAALRRAFEQLVARHDILRTRFHGEDRGMQEVLALRPTPFEVVDLVSLTAAQQEAELQRLCEAEAERPFDLAAEPLLRVCLIELAPEHHVLMLSMHHIISDGWSIGVILDEISRTYADARGGRGSALAPLPIQYADYAAWQRRLLEGEHEHKLERYWRDQLSGTLPALTLPSELPAPAQPSRLGDQLTLSVDRATLERLHAHGRQHRASLFMMLLAASGVLFHRITTQHDLILGTPVAGRTRPETEGLIGCFINALALRLDLSGNPSFSELLERVKAVCLGAYEHQDMPFEKLVELLQPERHLHQHPIFDILLNVVNVPARSPELDGLTLTPMELGAPQAKLGLTIYAAEEAGQLELRFVWQRDRYSAGQMHALAHQLASLLRQIAADPTLPIGRYSLVTDHDRAVLPDPGAALGGAPIATVPDLFRDAVVRHPEAVAIRARGRIYSYRTLARAAGAVSHRLLEGEGLAAGDCVVISGQRSFGLIAAMLGVLQAGGVILTLDKDTPAVRRREIIEEAGARRLIWVGRPGDPGSDICQDTEWQTTRFVDPVDDAAGSSAGSLPRIDPAGPAYLFFTSGTTGRPKGILGQHQALAHFLTWQRDTFQIGAGDRAAQLTGLGFDVVLRDILTPLISGATLCLLDDEDDLSAAALFPWLQREAVTLFHTVPTIAKSWLMDEAQLVELPALRQVFFAGEPLPSSLVRAFRRTVSAAARIVNLYGPTETTLAKASYVVPEDDQLPVTLPVGRAMTATQLLVLNAERRPCGVGEPGEVAIRTRFPSLGYLQGGRGAPQFLPSPFSGDAADLLYFTGDLGHFGSDGVLWLLGRKDDQVKIRGMRVELGEIHAALLSHPGVCEAAVVVFSSEGGDKHLAAYYVPRDAPPEPAALRSFVRSRLPEHMVPLVWIQLGELPTTLNGKLDRQRLPDPRTASPVRSSDYIAPSTELESVVVSVWQDVLRRPEIGIQENFFDAGGNSLLLLQVKTRLQAALHRAVPVVALFQHPTAAGLAGYLGGQHEQTAALAGVADRARLRKTLRQNRRRR